MVFNPAEHTILIVDDNPKNLQLLGSILKGNRFKVEFATNGIEAIDWIKDKPFDLVLLDIMMPGMDGFEVCKKIREERRNSDMPVIFLTAKTEKESIVKGFEMGAQDYISKPFNKSELMARVNTQLELRKSKIQLRDVNLLLEQKVAVRTAQLENANRQLKTLDDAKTEFLNLIGHELRTPLNGIVGPMEIIKTDYKGSELDLMLHLMDESVKRLEKFAYEALLITNLRSGKYVLKPQSLSLLKVFSELKELLSDILERSMTTLVLDIPERIIVDCDLELISTCFIKLNESTLLKINEPGERVIKAIEEGGTPKVIITDRRMRLSKGFLDSMNNLFEPEGEYVDANPGIGMVLVNLILNLHDSSLTLEETDPENSSIIISINKQINYIT